MRRHTPLAVLTIILLATIPTTMTSPATASTACTDSWGADGHTAPWYTNSTNTLHGNTVNISCPTSGTSWTVTYHVAKIVNGTVSYPISSTRSGTGSTSFSISASPLGCSGGAPYYTHVHNHATGGDIYKPSSKGVAIC